MVSLLYLLAQVQQPQRLPWAYLVLFGLLALVAVGLLIYFMTRVRKSEKDAEEDWGLSNRGILLTPTTFAASEVKKKSETAPEEVPLPKGPEPPTVVAASKPGEPRLVAESQSPAEPEPTTVIARPPDRVEAAEIIPSPAEQTVVESRHEAIAAPEPQLVQTGQPASPFDEEIWSQLESAEPTVAAGQAEFGRPEVPASSHKEPYEPPRIDPILPRKEQDQSVKRPVPGISSPASASQKSPANLARLEVPTPARQSGKPAPAAAGSILGLPAEVSAGPFVIDRSKGREDAVAVGTLANYDKPPDDAAGHSGTIALIVVVVIVCGSLAAYFALPPVHSRVDHLVAKVRGIEEPSQPVAQIFPSTLDATKEPAQAKGTLQNISDQALSGLVVIVSLDPRGGGAAVTQDVQVSPEEISPGQQGAFEFEIDAKKYQTYKIVGLKTRGGVKLPYVKPNQQQ